MSVNDGSMHGALILSGLTSEQIDAVVIASGRVDAGEDGRDFVSTDRENGEVAFGGNLDALYDALCAMAKEADSAHWHEICHETSEAFHEEFTDTFNGPL